MAYCRWSSMDYRCDLYVFDHVDDYTICWIASNRHTIPADRFPPEIPEDDPDWAYKFLERQRAVSDLIDQAERAPIGGPYDGQYHTEPTPAAMADWIEWELAPLGVYVFPDDLVANLREAEE